MSTTRPQALPKIQCNTCRTKTNHWIRHTFEQDDSRCDDGDVFWSSGKWQVVQCQGCESVSFRELWSTSDDYDPVTGEVEERETLYPPRTAGSITPRNYLKVPPVLRTLYRETCDAYNYGQNILCAGGLRAMVEGICADRSIKDGPVVSSEGTKRKDSLQGKIEGLHEKGVITKPHADTLHEHRYMGNESLHQLEPPSREELQLGIEIIEHVLESVYEVQRKADELRWRREGRKKGKDRT